MKKIIAIVALVFTGLIYVTSCSKTPVSPLIGTWRKIIPADTFYIKITDNTTFQYGETLDSGYVEQGRGTYTYTASQFTFTILSNPDSTSNGICIGYPATYTYTLGANDSTLTLGVVNDTCAVSGAQLRSAILTGNWQLQ